MIYGLTRLGSIGPNELTSRDLDVLKMFPQLSLIDITGQQSIDFFAHSHHTRNPSVSSDIILMLRHDLTPRDRGLTRDSQSPVWQFPEDYPDRVTGIAGQLYPPMTSD